MAISESSTPRLRRALAGALRAFIVIPACAAVIVGAASGVCRAGAAGWSFSGDSTLKAYWQTTFRLANTTNIRLSGGLGPLKLEGSLRLLGASYGLGSDAIQIGPWAEKIEKWSASARTGALSVTLGDTYVPVMSGRYLSGNSLHGAVASVGGEVAGIRATATAFRGANTVSSGLSVSTTQVTGAAVEASITPRLGLTLQGLAAEKEGVDLKMGGAQAWIKLGGLALDLEAIASRDDIGDRTGWLAAVGVSGSLLKGTATASGQYTSEGYASMSPAAPGGAGGTYELSTSWSGPVYSGGQNGVNASLAVGARAGGDNVASTLGAAQRSLSSDVSLTIRGREWLLRAKYGVNSKKSFAGESLTLGTVKRTTSLEAAAPFRLGERELNADALLSRTATHNVIDGGLRVNNAVLLRASTAVGSTSVSVKAGLSAESLNGGALTRQADVGLSMSRPVKLGKVTGLACGADLAGVDKVKDAAATRSAEAMAWLTYAPAARVSVTVRAKGQLTFAGADYSSISRGGWLEAEARVLF